MVERLKEMWQDARQMRDERGLTLVELLVVVVILGIIAAISVIAVGNLIENSRKDAQVANAKQLVNAAKLYIAANPVNPPAAGTDLYYVGDVGTSDPNVLSSYMDDLKDPMNNDGNYSTAKVNVTKVSGKYVYKATIQGNGKTYFNNVLYSDLKRTTLTETAIIPPASTGGG